MAKTVYRHTDDMGEISGFGGSYEEGCQKMLEAGVKWLAEHDADIQVLENPSIYGIIKEGTSDTEELSKAAVAATDDCTGAMHHAVMSRLAYIDKNGWQKYCEELRQHEAESAA